MVLRLPQNFDQAVLLPRLQRSSSPKGRGCQDRGRHGPTPEAVTDLVKARLRALAALTNSEVDDTLFHWARFANMVARAGYRSHLP